MPTVHINDKFIPFIKDVKSRYAVLWGGAGCFDGSTLVNTKDGHKPIMDINIGDMVLSFNEKEQIPEYKPVLDKFIYNTFSLKQSLYEFKPLNCEAVRCTGNHKFLYNGRWVPLLDLLHYKDNGELNYFKYAGNQARTINSSDLNGFNHIPGVHTVYDLQVADNANYCITTDNIIVHNSGKSVSAAQKIVFRCLNETGTEEDPFQHRIVVVRKYKASMKQSVFEQIKQVCISMGISDYVSFNESYLSFKFFNGSQIFCLGLDDPEKLKSLVATSSWVEEATELEEADFNQLDLRFRGHTPYYVQHIVSFNPIDESHWIKSKFFDNKKDDMVYILHSTYKDNHFIDEQYRRVLEERYKYDPNMYRIYVRGEWGHIKTGSEYYFNFKRDIHVRPAVSYISGLPLHISFDFNVNPYISAIIGQIYRRQTPDGKSFYFANIIDEFALANPQNNTERLCEAIIEKYRVELRHGVMIYGDASGRNRTTRSNISDYDIIEYAFKDFMSNVSMSVPKANPMIKKRRNFINKLLFGSFNIQYSVSPNCVKLINDFEVAIEEQDGSKKKQMAKDSVSHVVYEKNGHHADCNDYFLCAAFDKYFDSM